MFTVEDGSIVAGANAYITVAELDSYWSVRNQAINAGTQEKQAAIIIATQYVDLNNRFKGDISNDSQTLSWPRIGVYDGQGRIIESNEIPSDLKNAICEYAKRQIESDIQPDVDPNTGAVIREKVDVLERQFEEGTTGYFGIKSYPMADRWLAGLVVAGMGQLRRC